MRRFVPLVVLAGCGPASAPTPSTPKPPPAAVVTVAPVTERTVPRAVHAVGTLAGYEEATLAPKVDGRVTAVLADTGDPVYPGQHLLELETADYLLDVARSRRALELELAKIDRTELPPPGQGVDPETVPAVRRATLVLEAAKREWERTERIGSLSDRERQGALTEFKVAEAARRQAVSEVNAVVAAARLRQAEFELAEQRLADATLRAPVPAGFHAWAAAVGPAAQPLRYAVAGRYLSEGEMVRAMPVTNAFKLVLSHALKLKAAVPERFAAELKVGQPVAVAVDAYPAPFPGKLTRINPTVDPLNRTFQIEVSVPNLDGRLKAGGFARARVQTRTERVRTVPAEAVVSFAGVTKLFVVEGGTAKAVEVTVGDREKDWLEVIGPLPAGAQVATSGFSQLADGTTVRLRDAEPPQTPADEADKKKRTAP